MYKKVLYNIKKMKKCGVGGCERRIEVFVKIQKKFFFFGGGGRGVSGRGRVGGGSGWM